MHDIDFETGICSINKAVKYTAKYGGKIGAPKTDAAVRTLRLSRTAMAIAEKYRGNQRWLFTNRAGNRITSQLFYNHGWKKAIDAALADGLNVKNERPRVHDLRHTFISWNIHTGVPLAILQKYVGHKSITTTVNTYGHIDTQAHGGIVSAVDGVFGLETPPPTADERAAEAKVVEFPVKIEGDVALVAADLAVEQAASTDTLAGYSAEQIRAAIESLNEQAIAV